METLEKFLQPSVENFSKEIMRKFLEESFEKLLKESSKKFLNEFWKECFVCSRKIIQRNFPRNPDIFLIDLMQELLLECLKEFHNIF